MLDSISRSEMMVKHLLNITLTILGPLLHGRILFLQDNMKSSLDCISEVFLLKPGFSPSPLSCSTLSPALGAVLSFGRENPSSKAQKIQFEFGPSWVR